MRGQTVIYNLFRLWIVKLSWKKFSSFVTSPPLVLSSYLIINACGSGLSQQVEEKSLLKMMGANLKISIVWSSCRAFWSSTRG